MKGDSEKIQIMNVLTSNNFKNVLDTWLLLHIIYPTADMESKLFMFNSFTPLPVFPVYIKTYRDNNFNTG